MKGNILTAQKKQKQIYDQKHTIPSRFHVGHTCVITLYMVKSICCFFAGGAKVLKKDFLRKKRKGGKMDPQWLGPYVIATDLDKGFYALSDLNTGEIVTKRINAAHLKPYITLPAPDADTSLESVEVFSPNIVLLLIL